MPAQVSDPLLVVTFHFLVVHIGNGATVFGNVDLNIPAIAIEKTCRDTARFLICGGKEAPA